MLELVNSDIGINGTIAFKSGKYEDYKIFNSSTIEDLTHFKTTIKTDQNTEKYEVNCRLFIFYDDEINVVCQFEKNLPFGENLRSCASSS